MNEEVRHFSLRKLSVGLASVLVGVSIFGASQTVKADTVADQTASAVTNNTQSSDTQENKNASESSFLNDNQPANAKSKTTQTQENEPKQVQAENVRQDSAPKTQEVNDGSNLDAEKDIVRTSSLQDSNNQSNDHSEDNSQPQTSQKLDLTKTSPKFNRKVLATNLIETDSSPMTNGGFDEATWGKLDVNDWQGSVQDGVYQLTDYTGDEIHIIVPNEADFEKAGRSTNGLQVGITRDTVRSLFSNRTQTIAFSKTNDQKVKAIGTDWSHAFAYNFALSKFDGSNLDVSNVTNMSGMFDNNSISDLTSLANWNVSNVTNMKSMFSDNQISDLTPLKNWDMSKVTDMSSMFLYNGNISDLAPLTNWDVGNVTNMRGMFAGNKISDLTGLANWNVSNVIGMSGMFAGSFDLIDLKPIANWNISDINDYYGRGFSSLFDGDTKLDLTNINNTPLMQSFLEKPIMLQSSAFITNNADLVKATAGKDVPILTNTAKRTIVFHFPDGTQKEIDQIINFKTIAPVQVNWPAPPDFGQSAIALVSRGMGTLIPYDPNNPHHVTPDSPNPVDPDSDNPYSPKIIKTYPVKASDWQLDTSKQNDAIIVNGQIHFKSVKIPHINGYKAHFVRNPLNPALFMVSFMAVPTENKPSTPVEVTPSKPSAPVDNPSKPSAPVDKPSKSADDLKQRVVTELNNNDSGWTMPNTQPATYTVEVPDDNTINLSDLVIAEPVHAHTRTQIHVNKHFKLRKHGKKHSIKHLKHRKKTARTFKKYRL